MVLALDFKLNSCWSGRERSYIFGLATQRSILFYFACLPGSFQHGVFFLGGVVFENKGIDINCLDILSLHLSN